MEKKFTIATNKDIELVDITHKVEDIVAQSNVKDGLCLIFVPHSTAAVVITENESGLINDWENFLTRLTPDINYQHDRIDDNAQSHLLSGLLGQMKVLPIKNNQLERGTWQQIFLAELDGPRSTRNVVVKIVAS
jgi:secondary thiamine-phosphate synthase enzyme